METKMIYTSAWQEALAALLKTLPPDARLALVGLGNPLRGDDRAGLAVTEKLGSLLVSLPGLLILPAGQEPARILNQMRRFEPDIIIFIDAMHVDAPAGTTAWLDPEAIDGISASTHAYPLTMLTHYLQTEYNCAIGLIGIRPAQVDVDTPLSSPVAAAVDRMTAALAQILLASRMAAALEAD